jgi:[citrate (pro-3S)-lyase] ligase
MIKQAFLSSEFHRLERFLATFDLGFDAKDESFYIEEADQIIASLSLDGMIIKGLAIDESYRGMNLAGELVGYAIQVLAGKGLYSYHVFTKSKYVEVFRAMGFRLLADTGKVAFMEGGLDHIESIVTDIRKKFETTFKVDPALVDIGAIVVNCNPMTLGHYQLIEQAAREHDYLIVFVVETDESTFTFKERFSLVYLALKPISNILVVASTSYIVSKSTFPSYFLKTLNEREEEHAKLDAMIFRDYFMPLIPMSTRHVGGETDPVMVAYNRILKETLKDRLKAIERFTLEGVVISASLVRKLMFENRIDAALEYVPIATRALLRTIMIEKNAK